LKGRRNEPRTGTRKIAVNPRVSRGLRGDFSGKKSKRVDGIYYSLAKEIIIHNKNFVDAEGKQNENRLMFTAIHELAHHVMRVEKGDKSSRSHSKEFWATFHDLLDIAEKKCVYRAEIDTGTQKLIKDARDISRQIAKLQRELGRILLDIEKSCYKNGLDREDIIERKAQISKHSTKAAVVAYIMGDQGVGADIQAEAAKQCNKGKRATIIAAGQEGKSVIQAKKTAAPARTTDSEDKTATLILEKRRIERTVESLTRRLEEIKQQLIARGEDSGGGS
jgi:hypothetical protein